MSRILVVDDEPDLRYLLRPIFEHAGHEVTEANHGAAALDLALAGPPDLIVTDMMMPVMGGAELITRLRAHPVTAAIPILAVTGDGQVAGAADTVLARPAPPDQLVAAATP